MICCQNTSRACRPITSETRRAPARRKSCPPGRLPAHDSKRTCAGWSIVQYYPRRWCSLFSSVQTAASLEAFNGPATTATCSNTRPQSTIGAGQHVVSRPCRTLNRDGFSTNLPPWWNGRHQSSRLRLATALDVLSAEQECGLLTLSQISCRGTMSGILSVRDASTPKPRK